MVMIPYFSTGLISKKTCQKKGGRGRAEQDYGTIADTRQLISEYMDSLF